MADRAACPIVKTLLGKLKLPNARGQANADRASIFGYPYETDDLKLILCGDCGDAGGCLLILA
jgi:hypothetical protein